MALFIRELPQFHQDVAEYTNKIESIEDKEQRALGKSLLADFLLKVEAVDRSVEDMAGGFSAVGLQHSTFTKDLKEARLKLHRFVEKKCN
jgi:hypothetical protein